MPVDEPILMLAAINNEIRRATNGNFALGDARFAAQVSAALERRVTPGQSGRPRKSLEPASETRIDSEA